MLGNLNGNVGRPYYICVCCKGAGRRTHSVHERGWITWDDDRGISPSNPNCDCGIPSRQDKAGVGSRRQGMGFSTCASGACDYYSEFLNGQTWKEAGTYTVPDCVTFLPWLI